MLLNETINTPTFLFESVNSKSSDLKMKFAFIYADRVNENKRIYPKSVLESAISAMRSRLTKNSVFGSSSHPRDFELDDVSHIVEDVALEGDKGICFTKIVPTSKGKNLAAIIKGGGKLGVSARGVGSLKKNEKGVDEVQSDYQLLGIDFVVSPSFGIHVGQESIYESIIENQYSQAKIDTLYINAIRAGFRGSKNDYIEKVLWK